MRARPGRRVLTILALLLGAGVLPASAQVSATWYDINPSSSNHGSPNAASGGRVNRVAAASDFSRVYAATELGGLYTSFDQGVTWVRINTYSPTATWDVKVDPTNNNRIYATSFFDGRVQPFSGINISDDAGTTWRAVNIPGLNALNCLVARARNEPSGWQIAINASITRTVFAGTNCGLGRSLDGGATWNFIDPSPADGVAEQVYSVVAHGRQTVDVITDNGHFRSPDNGTTWSGVPVAGPVAGNSGAGTSVTVSPHESYVLLAANTQVVPNPAGGPNLVGNNIWESVDGGATWPTSLTPPLGNAQGRVPFIKTNQLTSTQFDVWFGDVGVFRTTATTPSPPALGGAARTPSAWASAQTGAHADVGDVLFDPRFTAGSCPSLFSNDGGVYRNIRINNPDCQTPAWTQPTITPHATWLFGMDGVRQSPGIHALAYGLQDDGGWAASVVAEGHNPPPPNWNNYTCCDINQNTQGGTMLSLEGVFGGPRGFQLFRRNRDGSSPTQLPTYPSPALFTGFTSGNQNAQFGATGAVVNLGAPANPAAPVGTGVFFTNDITAGTVSWTALNAPTAAVSTTGNLRLANLGGRPNVYYHTGNGNPNSTGAIFRSTLVANTGAPGANWTQLTLPAGIATATVWDVDPNDGRRVILAGIAPGFTPTFQIWMTVDFGGNWRRLNALENVMLGVTPTGPTFLNQVAQGRNSAFGFGYWQPTLLKFNPLDATTIVAGAMDSGVFVSLDNGDNWRLISNPTNPTSTSPHVPRPIFAYFSPGRFAASTSAFDVWVGTAGAGVMKVVLERRR